MSPVEVAVVGGGTVGITAALAARHAGASVCLVEREPRLGGDCTFYGCVPSKTLLALAKVAHDARLAADAGILDRRPNVVFSRVAERRNAVVAEIAGDERDERFADAGIEVVHGDARFAADHELEVGERTIRSERVVIATGSEPSLPDLPGIAELCLTNRTILGLDELPARLAVLGGGSTGLAATGASPSSCATRPSRSTSCSWRPGSVRPSGRSSSAASGSTAPQPPCVLRPVAEVAEAR